MASGFTGQVTAVQVGTFFVRQYYHVLQQQPNLAYQFYNDASMMKRVDGESTETANATLEIHNLILTLNFTGIEIKAANFMNSWDGGVLAMVSGFVETGDYNQRRKFVQTFFLAPQEKGYFVLNDIFYFLDEEHVLQQAQPSGILTHSALGNNLPRLNPVHEAVPEYMLGEEIQSREYEDQAEEEGNNNIDDYHISQSQQQESYYDSRADESSAEEPVVSYANTASTRHEPTTSIIEEHFEEPTKHTYASILRIAKGLPSNLVSHSAPSLKPTPVTSEWHQVPLSSQQSFVSSSKRPEKFNSEPEDYPNPEEEVGISLSVYVGNLNSSITEYDLEREFKKFGRLRPDGVAIRSRKESGIYYGFIEFEDIIGVQNALKASSLTINGWEIYVEERRPNSGLYRGGRRGRGRGGYQLDAPRGRFGGHGYGRTSYDSSDKEYNSKTRGDGYYQRTPRQGN